MPNDDSALPRGTATSRSECRCPDCLSYEGLEEIPEAAQLYDDPVDEILHASQCANDACPTTKVNSKTIRKQIDKSAIEESEPLLDFSDISVGGFIDSSKSFAQSQSWKIAGVVLLFVISATFGTLGGFNGGGIAEASDAYDGIETESGTSPEVIYESGNWTIYESGNSYIVSGVIDGSIVYLTPDGEVTDSPHRFDNLSTAKEAITLWQARHDQLPSKYPEPEVTDSLIDQSEWQVFSYNGSYIVAGEINGEVVFLQPNGDYSSEPYFYDTKGDAEQSILYWVSLSQTYDLTPVGTITESELQGVLSNWDSNEDKFDVWSSTDLGNWTVYTNGSAYVAVTSIDGESVYLQDPTVSTTPVYYDSSTTLLDTLSSWRDNNPDANPQPIAESPDLGKEWELIDNQETIPDNSTSEELTTSEDESLSTYNDSTSNSTSGTPIAGSVRNTDNDPISGATVTLHSNPQTTTTDSNGEFVFSDVPEGNHTIHVAPPSGTNLAGPRNTSIQVNSDGEVTAQNDPENVLYFENDAGAISQNHLTFIAQEKQPIELHGKGSAIRSTIEVANPSNIDDVTVQFDPEYTATQRDWTLSGDSASDILTLDGATKPQSQQLILDAESRTKNTSVSGTSSGETTKQIDIIGNQNPESPSLSIDPVASQENKTWAGDWQPGDGTVTANPNSILDPDMAYLTLDGWYHETENSKSIGTSGSDSISVSNNGNLDTNATVRIKPEINTETHSNRGSYSSGEILIENPSNTPTEAEITITGKEKEYTQSGGDSVYSYPGGGRHDLKMTASKSYSFTSHMSAGTYTIDYSINTKGLSLIDGSVSFDEGAISTRGTYSTDYRSQKSWQENITITSGETLMAGTLSAYSSLDWSGSTSSVSYTLRQMRETGRVTLDNSNDHAETAHLEDGDVDTVTFMLEPGTNTIPVSFSGGHPEIGVSASFKSETVTEDVRFELNGNEVYHEPSKIENERTVEINGITPGENTIGSTIGYGTSTYEIDWHDRYGVENVQATMGGNEVFNHSGVYKDNTTVEIPGNLVGATNTTLGLDTTAGNISYALTIPARNTSVGPEVSLGNWTLVSHEGPLHEKKTVEIPSSEFEPGTNKFDFQVEDGSVNYTIDYAAKATPEQASVRIGSETFAWPSDFDASGPLPESPNSETKINISSLSVGDQPVSIETDPVDGIETGLNATLLFDGETKQSSQPKIAVIQPDGSSHAKPVPDTALENGQLVTSFETTIPDDWFSTGKNTVIVETADDSVVSTTITTEGLNYQNKTMAYGS